MSRIDLFTQIHKALRAMTYDCAARLQAADLDDPAAADAVLRAVERTVATVEQHREHEDALIFPDLAKHEPALIRDLTAEHAEIADYLGRVLEGVDEVRATPDGGARIVVGDELTRRLNDAAALYLGHFAREERTLLPASQRHLDDNTLLAIRGRIIASLPPEHFGEQLEWMCRSLNPSELVGLLAGAKTSMPEQAFAGMANAAEAAMGPERWALVSRKAGLTADAA